MSYLLDTNVISELRKPAGRASMNVRVWAGRQRTSDLLISVITVMEIEIRVARLERRDSVHGDVLRKWLERDLLCCVRHTHLASGSGRRSTRVRDARPGSTT